MILLVVENKELMLNSPPLFIIACFSFYFYPPLIYSTKFKGYTDVLNPVYIHFKWTKNLKPVYSQCRCFKRGGLVYLLMWVSSDSFVQTNMIPEGEEGSRETIWLRWKGLLSQTSSLSWPWCSNASCLLARKYSVALTIASPRHVFTLCTWIRTAVILHFCCCLLLLYVCTTKIIIIWHRASINWTVKWQRGDYWDTGRINDLTLFVKNMYSHVENVLFSPTQWAFHLRFTCCTREAL